MRSSESSGRHPPPPQAGPGSPPRALPSGEPGGPTRLDCPYAETPSGLEWRKGSGQGEKSVLLLTNFTARIVADVVLDDGVETQRWMQIEVVLKGGRHRFTIPASKFGGMNWPAEHLGPEAIVYPGYATRDHARTAIQLLSVGMAKRRIYAHTGWRENLGEWIYLHGGGAIGPRGKMDGIEVQLPEALRRFCLPAPPEGTTLVAAINSALKLLDLGPDHVTVSLLGAVWRAPLGETDFSLHLSGPTGVYKTEIAALSQQFWGDGLDARHLPASWSGTGNALEALAFVAKDAILVVDDFAPTGTVNDARRQHREADRLLRAQGNRAGRLRMHSDATLNPAKMPRGLILSTGEDVPNGQSLRARVWVLEVEEGAIRLDLLTLAQADAAACCFSLAMSGYIRWLSAQFEMVRRNLRSHVFQIRAGVNLSGSHPRAPEIFANLAVGWAHFIEFAQHAGALSSVEADTLRRRVAAALHQAAAAQSHHLAAAEPTTRFLDLVSAALVSGRAHLAAADGGRPEFPETLGWRKEAGRLNGSTLAECRPMGELVGWTAGDDIYLEPESSFAVAQRLAREQGEELTVGRKTLHKRLAERGLLASRDEKRGNLVRRSLAGRRRNVLHVWKPVLVGEKSDQSAQGGLPLALG